MFVSVGNVRPFKAISSNFNSSISVCIRTAIAQSSKASCNRSTENKMNLLKGSLEQLQRSVKKQTEVEVKFAYRCREERHPHVGFIRTLQLLSGWRGKVLDKRGKGYWRAGHWAEHVAPAPRDTGHRARKDIVKTILCACFQTWKTALAMTLMT